MDNRSADADHDPILATGPTLSPGQVLSWILLVGLTVRLGPLLLRAVEQSREGSALMLAWTALVWLGLGVAYVVAALSVRSTHLLRTAVRIFVAVTVIAVLSWPWVTSSVFPAEVRPWPLSLPVTASATSALVSRRWQTNMLALLAVVGSTVWSEVGIGWTAPVAVVVADALYAVTLFLAWTVAIATFVHAHSQVTRAHAAAAGQFRSLQRHEAHHRAAAVWDAFLHDEVIATLSQISNATDPDGDRAAATKLLSRIETAGGVPPPSLTDGVMHAVMTRWPEADTTFTVAPDARPLTDEVAAALIDAAAEALRNVARHAYPGDPSATPHPTDMVTLDHDAEGVVITVRDSGVGFDPLTVSATSLGLSVGIHARLAAVGGDSRVESAPGQGTTVEVRWPR